MNSGSNLESFPLRPFFSLEFLSFFFCLLSFPLFFLLPCFLLFLPFFPSLLPFLVLFPLLPFFLLPPLPFTFLPPFPALFFLLAFFFPFPISVFLPFPFLPLFPFPFLPFFLSSFPGSALLTFLTNDLTHCRGPFPLSMTLGTSSSSSSSLPRSLFLRPPKFPDQAEQEFMSSLKLSKSGSPAMSASTTEG